VPRCRRRKKKNRQRLAIRASPQAKGVRRDAVSRAGGAWRVVASAIVASVIVAIFWSCEIGQRANAQPPGRDNADLDWPVADSPVFNGPVFNETVANGPVINGPAIPIAEIPKTGITVSDQSADELDSTGLFAHAAPILTEAEPFELVASQWQFYERLDRNAAAFNANDPWPAMPVGEPPVMPDEATLALDSLHGKLVDRPRDSTTDSGKKKLKPTANITVEIQSDFAWFDQDANNIATVGEIPDGAFFRRARFGVFGELYETVEYRLEFDFAGNARPLFLDNWIALTNIPVVKNLIVGHYFEPFSLERYSPNRFITFTERSLADTFVPARNMGMMLYGNALDGRMAFAAGGFRSGSDDYGDDVSFNSGYAGTVHATYLPWFEEYGQDNLRLLHLGGSASYRSTGDDPVNYSTRPSVRMRQQGVGGVPVFVSTGDLDDASHVTLAGLEAAWVNGPFSLQSEVIMSEVNRRQNDNPRFLGGYVYGSWFLTGESRSYSPTSILGRFREGIFQRTVPRSNVFDPNSGTGWTGCGAIELAVRWAFIDLNDAGVNGGYLEDMTYGVNWYLNPYTKVMLNYVRPRLDDPTNGISNADMYALRFQFEF